MRERKTLTLEGALAERCAALVPRVKMDPTMGVLFPRVDAEVVARLALLRGLEQLEAEARARDGGTVVVGLPTPSAPPALPAPASDDKPVLPHTPSSEGVWP